MMKRTFLLNWLPYGNTATGAARRAIELHSRVRGDFLLKAAVTSEFPAECAPEVERVVLAPSRTVKTRFAEGTAGFWKSAGEFDVWVGDTLPVPCFPRRVKVVLTVHDLRFLEKRSYLKLQRYLLLRAFMGRALKRADAVVTVSHWAAEQLSVHYGTPPEKLHVITNSAAELPSSVHVSLPDERYILSVGHFEPRKDHETLIKAFAAVAGEWSGNLVMVGRGWLEKDLKTMTDELGLSKRVIFAGGVSDGELAWLYKNCCCLACPSLYEGFGMTILEGLGAGVPVVASSIPPHREVGGDAVNWFSSGNADELALSLKKILFTQEEWDPSPGLTRAGCFSWEESALKLEKLYDTLQGLIVSRELPGSD